ncbi:MAG: hypothetical protein IT285_10375 [Bdellovibrionales bacterium]|nr:hypothetical protein [Bdellovibrionales bacterium]
MTHPPRLSRRTLSLLILPLLAALPSAARADLSVPAGDRTNEVLARYTGVQVKGELQGASGIRGVLKVDDKAAALVAAGTFDVSFPSFDATTFYPWVAEEYSSGLQGFHELTSLPTIGEIHVILTDLGEARRGTICEAMINSRVIHCDVRRWHKFRAGYSRDNGRLSAMHEYAHVQHYHLMGLKAVTTAGGNAELLRFDRELKAILTEIPNFERVIGMSMALRRHRALSGEKAALVTELSRPQLSALGQPGRRALAWGLASALVDGQIAASGSPAVAATLAAVLREALLSELRGPASMDEVFARLGLSVAVTGRTLTLESLRSLTLARVQAE